MRTDSISAGTSVLITGATGFTGACLMRRLVGQGASVKAIARPSSDLSPFEDLDVEWIRGDVFDPDVVDEAMRDVQYLFHLAACYRDPRAAPDAYSKVHVESTKLLANAALRSASFARFVHTSTVGVHGHIQNPPANEEAPYSPGDTYQDTKLEAELWLRQFAEENALSFSVVRPAAIFGPGDRRLLKLFKFAERGWCPLLDHHDTLYHLIHVEDLVEFFLRVATHPAAEGEAFICGNEEATSIKSIMHVLGEFFGRKVRFLSLPSRPLFMLADASERVCSAINVAPILYRRRLAFFTKDRSFDTGKSRRLLDFRCRYDNRSGLLQTGEAYVDAGWIKR